MLAKFTEAISEAVNPENLLDYIYAILHHPTYRSKYKEFLKINFPRIPLPKNKEQFFILVNYGKILRELHLLVAPCLSQTKISYPISGSNIVEKPHFASNKIYINDTQYFENATETARTFRIGGYQPAQKWLKDRKGLLLNFEDIVHYQKMLSVLSKTAEVMKEIEKVKM
jgi:predicted helicase